MLMYFIFSRYYVKIGMIPPHRQECYKDWNDIKLPITERIHAEELSLPISPVISSHDINFIIELINNKTW